MGKPDIATDRRAATNRDAAQDGDTRINNDIVFYDRKSSIAFDKHTVIVFLETFGAQGHGLIDANMTSYHGGLADDHTGAVVDKKLSPICAPGCMSMPVAE